MSESADVVSVVNAEINAALELNARRIGAISPDAAPLAESITSLSHGGKRMRALLCYWGWRAGSGLDLNSGRSTPALKAGAAIELFQTAALIHDDIIDRSATRRGVASAHEQFSAIHTSGNFDSDHVRFGHSAAILAGDIALALSEELFGSALENLSVADQTQHGTETASSALSPAGRARTLFSTMHIDVMAGQYLDLRLEVASADASPTDIVEAAMTVARYKSAKYSSEQPLLIGAALAGANDALLSAMSDFALPLGEAFQLRDDVLGVFGNPQATGKPSGDDIREGKRTVLIGYGLQGALSQADAEHLRACLGRETLNDDDLARCLEGLRLSGALQRVEDDIATLTARSLAALETLEIPSDVATELRTLALATVSRKA